MESFTLKHSISRKRLQNLCIKQRKQIIYILKVTSKNCEKQSLINNDLDASVSNLL